MKLLALPIACFTGKDGRVWLSLLRFDSQKKQFIHGVNKNGYSQESMINITDRPDREKWLHYDFSKCELVELTMIDWNRYDLA